MSINIDHVQRGELITALLINEIIDDLVALDVRVTALEQASKKPGAVEIDTVWKTTVNVGDDITIIGKNFAYSIGATRVRFNAVPPKVFRDGSNDSTLICQVPDLGTLPAEGLPVSLTVSNATSTAQVTITVKPAPVEVAGAITVNFNGVSPDPVQADHIADFEFVVQSQAVGTVHAAISSTVVDSTGAPLNWGMALLNGTKQTDLDQGEHITVDEGGTLSYFVRVTPQGTTGTSFTVTFTADAVEVSGEQDSATVSIGAESPTDTTFTFAPVDFSGPGVTLEGTALAVPLNTVGQVDFSADFTVAGAYDVDFTPAQGTTGWTLAVVDPALDTTTGKHTRTIGQSDIQAGNGTASEKVEIRARPGGNATAGQATVTVTREGQTKSRSFTFELSVIAT